LHKKQLKQAGWEVAQEGGETSHGYHLVLRRADGAQVRIEAATRPRAYAQAARHVESEDALERLTPPAASR
jgi:hypothetical protein